jgi:hypothetical protein
VKQYKYLVPVLGILTIWFASQSSLFSSADMEESPALSRARPACPTEPTMETITLTGDFGIFTRPVCPDPTRP